MSVEERLKLVEQWIRLNNPIWQAVILGCNSLLNDVHELKDAVHKLGRQLDNQETLNKARATNLRDYSAKITQYANVLDAKISAIATLTCRELELEPDKFIEEYKTAMKELGERSSDIENLIKETKKDPEVD
jgi:hypothetical protein